MKIRELKKRLKAAWRALNGRAVYFAIGMPQTTRRGIKEYRRELDERNGTNYASELERSEGDE